MNAQDKDEECPMYEKVIVRVREVHGECGFGHVVGQEFEEPFAVCPWAAPTVQMFAAVLRCGGSFPWEGGEQGTWLACPDPVNRVVYEVVKSEE